MRRLTVAGSLLAACAAGYAAGFATRPRYIVTSRIDDRAVRARAVADELHRRARAAARLR